MSDKSAAEQAENLPITGKAKPNEPLPRALPAATRKHLCRTASSCERGMAKRASHTHRQGSSDSQSEFGSVDGRG